MVSSQLWYSKINVPGQTAGLEGQILAEYKATIYLSDETGPKWGDIFTTVPFKWSCIDKFVIFIEILFFSKLFYECMYSTFIESIHLLQWPWSSQSDQQFTWAQTPEMSRYQPSGILDWQHFSNGPYQNRVSRLVWYSYLTKPSWSNPTCKSRIYNNRLTNQTRSTSCSVL